MDKEYIVDLMLMFEVFVNDVILCRIFMVLFKFLLFEIFFCIKFVSLGNVILIVWLILVLFILFLVRKLICNNDWKWELFIE